MLVFFLASTSPGHCVRKTKVHQRENLIADPVTENTLSKGFTTLGASLSEGDRSRYRNAVF